MHLCIGIACGASVLFSLLVVACALFLSSATASIVIRLLVVVFLAVAIATTASFFLYEAPAEGSDRVASSLSTLLDGMQTRTRRWCYVGAVVIVVCAILLELLFIYTVFPALDTLFADREVLLAPLMLLVALGSLAFGFKVVGCMMLRSGTETGSFRPSRSCLALGLSALLFLLAVLVLMCMRHVPFDHVVLDAVLLGIEDLAACAIAGLFTWYLRNRMQEEIASAEAAASSEFIGPPKPYVVISESKGHAAGCKAAAEYFDLSSAEQDVLLRLVERYTRQEIASTLYVSVATVNTHVQHIYQKTGVHKQLELIDLVESFEDAE